MPALLAIGGYASALLALDLGWPVGCAMPAGRADHRGARHRCWSSRRSGCAGTTSRSRRSASARSSALVILNWESLTRGPIGLTGIPPLSLFGIELDDARARSTGSRWPCWSLLAPAAVRGCCARISAATWRAIRDDDVAARAYGIGARPLQGAGLRVRRLRGGHRRRDHGASLFLHQLRDLRRAALDPGADHGDPGRHGQRARRDRRRGAADRRCRSCSASPPNTGC